MTETELKACKCVDCKEPAEYWLDCSYCDENGMSHHDCGEDCCCCLNPEDDVPCDLCNGNGGWFLCVEHAPKGNEELQYVAR